jgi:hypothetical protein
LHMGRIVACFCSVRVCSISTGIMAAGPLHQCGYSRLARASSLSC